MGPARATIPGKSVWLSRAWSLIPWVPVLLNLLCCPFFLSCSCPNAGLRMSLPPQLGGPEGHSGPADHHAAAAAAYYAAMMGCYGPGSYAAVGAPGSHADARFGRGVELASRTSDQGVPFGGGRTPLSAGTGAGAVGALPPGSHMPAGWTGSGGMHGGSGGGPAHPSASPVRGVCDASS